MVKNTMMATMVLMIASVMKSARYERAAMSPPMAGPMAAETLNATRRMLNPVARFSSGSRSPTMAL